MLLSATALTAAHQGVALPCVSCACLSSCYAYALITAHDSSAIRSGRDGYRALSCDPLARTKHSVPAYVPVGEYLRMKVGRVLVTRIRGQP